MAYTTFTLSSGEPESADCGFLGEVVLLNYDSVARFFIMGGGGIRMESNGVSRFSCSGDTVLQALACNPDTCFAQVLDRDLPVQSALMGLGGLLCGLLIAWAFMKSL